MEKLPINYHLKEFFKIDFSITICVSHCSHYISIPLCTLIYLALIHFILCTRLTACTVFLIILYPPSFLLEIRVIIKLSSLVIHQDEAKNFLKKNQNQNGWLKKTDIFDFPNSQYFFCKDLSYLIKQIFLTIFVKFLWFFAVTSILAQY